MIGNLKYLTADSVAGMRARVSAAVEAGMDVYGPMFVTRMNHLCIPLVEHAALYDYALVSGESLGELEDAVNGLMAVGFDLLHGVVVFQDLEDGQYLQWMCKMREVGSLSMKATVDYAAIC